MDLSNTTVCAVPKRWAVFKFSNTKFRRIMRARFKINFSAGWQLRVWRCSVYTAAVCGILRWWRVTTDEVGRFLCENQGHHSAAGDPARVGVAWVEMPGRLRSAVQCFQRLLPSCDQINGSGRSGSSLRGLSGCPEKLHSVVSETSLNTLLMPVTCPGTILHCLHNRLQFRTQTCAETNRI